MCVRCNTGTTAMCTDPARHEDVAVVPVRKPPHSYRNEALQLAADAMADIIAADSAAAMGNLERVSAMSRLAMARQGQAMLLLALR